MSQDIKPSEITSETVYQNRRHFMQAGLVAASGVATFGLYRHFNPALASTQELTAKSQTAAATQADVVNVPDASNAVDTLNTPNTLKQITHYNNFYEFSTNKTAVAAESAGFITTPWALEVGGLVAQPTTFGMEDLLKFAHEERIYRLRCVEGWSMVIPWDGFPLKALLDVVKPLGSAKYVAFETYYDAGQMPNGRFSGIDLPYVEGMRLDEAMHPLTLLATGIYGKPMPNANGAPVRLVVPWKYGFKSIKSIVKITLTDQQPPTTWNIANAREYGFYSNVNPSVDHPRWSQADEQRIGEFSRRPSLLFNGYADEVANLYAGMDLKKYF